MFINKIKDPHTHTLNLVRCINVPESNSLLGIHPILAVVCNTDNGSAVVDTLKSIRSDENDNALLKSTVQYCVRSSIYPHAHTVWSFNDPEVEIRTLNSYLDGESDDLESIIRLHKDTYPFIAVEEHSTDLPVVRQSKSGPTDDTNRSHIHTTIESPPRMNEYSYRSTPSVLVPALALGSMYMLSKWATKDQGDI